MPNDHRVAEQLVDSGQPVPRNAMFAMMLTREKEMFVARIYAAREVADPVAVVSST
jgi:hypothetical protein